MTKQNMDAQTAYIVEQAMRLLAIDSPSGFTTRATDALLDELRVLGYAPVRTRKGSVLVEVGGEGNPIVVSAHVDTLGGMVAEVKPNGRLRITNIGGMNANNAEAENCRVYTRDGKVISGTLQLCDASIHVNGEYNQKKRSFDEMEVVLDAFTTSREETKALGIGTGDFVCFDPRTVLTESGYLKSRFLDDKMSAAVLLGFAKLLRERGITPCRKVTLCFTVYEEVGHGCSGIVPPDTAEILSVDMGCVGEGLECTERQVSICAKDSRGPYNYDVTTALIQTARRHAIPYAVDVYPHYASDADAALDAGSEIRHALIGQGVYASHGYERTHIEGVKATFDLLAAYLCEESEEGRV